MKAKFIFLTGGAKRIGKTTCKHFHEEGFNIIFHYNSSNSAKEIFNDEEFFSLPIAESISIMFTD